MKEYLFLAGQIRALESKLLASSQVERMVGAADPVAAFRVFTELQYAEYMDKEVKAEEFGLVIDRGLQETKQLIKKGTENARELQVLWKEFDLNNVKRALKQSLVEGKSSLDNFSEENGFSLLGDISEEDLNAVVFLNEDAELFPLQYLKVIRESQSIYKKAGNFQAVELALDIAHFEFLFDLAKECSSVFLKEYATLKADLSNAKSFIRLLASNQTPEARYFVSHGKIPITGFLNLQNREDLEDLFNTYEYFALSSLFRKCTELYTDLDEFILHFERIVSSYYEQFLIESEEGVLGGVQIPMVYFLKRVKNARTLKFIMFSKLYGLVPERIYQTLKHL